jgi:hypothetical protein
VLTVGLKETPCPWISGTSKAMEAMKPVIGDSGRSHKKMKISSREEWSFTLQTQ